MLPRRALLSASLTGLMPPCVRAQDPPGAALTALLSQLLAQHQVPGAGAVLIREGKIADTVNVGSEARTLFQVASVGKVVAAIVTLLLAEQGLIELDRPVNDALRSWRLGGPDAGRVTPRMLLGHRAGTTIGGFAGYAPGSLLPTLVELLSGSPPANSAAVRVAWPPDQGYRYSGGGTTVLQLLVEDVTGRPFQSLAKELVFGPVGMNRSTFDQPLTAADGPAADGHDLRGRMLPGRCRVYPEQAAAGLWSTAGDLGRLALAIAASWRSGGLLSRASAQLMATPVAGSPSGAGIFVQPRGVEPPYLYHYGVNAGFRAVLAFVADASFGVALTTNGDGGAEVLRTFLGTVFERSGLEPLKPSG
ncbi:MAG: serine hydrolase domain-containing protein [Reyranellaceae bacterium]